MLYSSVEIAAGTACGTACSRQRQFVTSKSSTFVDGGRTSTITFGTGVGVDPVVGNNWQLSLRSSTDTVAVGGISVPKTSFFLITKQTPTFLPDPFDGIMGLGATAQGWFAGAVSQGLPCKRSIPHIIFGNEYNLCNVNQRCSVSLLTQKRWEVPS